MGFGLHACKPPLTASSESMMMTPSGFVPQCRTTGNRERDMLTELIRDVLDWRMTDDRKIVSHCRSSHSCRRSP